MSTNAAVTKPERPRKVAKQSIKPRVAEDPFHVIISTLKRRGIAREHVERYENASPLTRGHVANRLEAFIGSCENFARKPERTLIRDFAELYAREIAQALDLRLQTDREHDRKRAILKSICPDPDEEISF
jgi:hypothetical protein